MNIFGFWIPVDALILLALILIYERQGKILKPLTPDKPGEKKGLVETNAFVALLVFVVCGGLIALMIWGAAWGYQAWTKSEADRKAMDAFIQALPSPRRVMITPIPAANPWSHDVPLDTRIHA